jgi:hypothetical protein
MIEPWPRVWTVGRGKPIEITGSALKAACRSVDRRHRGKRSAAAGEIENLKRSSGFRHCHAHPTFIPPQARQRRFAVG